MLLTVVVTVLLAVAPAFGQQTCTAECNCDLSNIQMLDQVIENKVNQTFANEPSKSLHNYLPSIKYTQCHNYWYHKHIKDVTSTCEELNVHSPFFIHDSYPNFENWW